MEDGTLKCRVGNKIVRVNKGPNWKEEAVRKANEIFNENVATAHVEIISEDED